MQLLSIVGLAPVEPERISSSVSIGLGGLVSGCWRCRTAGAAPVARGGGPGRTPWALGIGMSPLSLDMDRDGPAAEPKDPGCGDSVPSSTGGPSSMLVES